MCKYSQKQRDKKGFTLVELSIVMVIIGLLVSGVLVGKSMMVSAETKTLLSEVQKLSSAVGSFQSLYKGMPGDIGNATTYFGVGTANGNGSGKIDSEGNSTAALRNEPFLALQQLSMANMLEGSYKGFTGLWTNGAVDGFAISSPSVIGNVIGAKGRAGGALYIKCCSGAFSTANYDYSRTLTFNNHINLFSIYTTDITKRAGILTPIEAMDIDKKIDDGVPDTGLVGASGSYNGAAYVGTGCYAGTGSSSTYNSADATTKNQPNCQMQFAIDWN